MTSDASEAALYGPLKAYLERLGYAVKGEVNDCDVVARRGEEPPVVVELKLRLSLALLVQAVERQRMTDAVYVAVPAAQRRSAFWKRYRRGLKRLCLKLGVGVLLVDEDAATVETLWDPTPYRPRRDPGRLRRLLKEFEERQGDPDVGGSAAQRRMTAYRQRVLRIARHLWEHGPTRVAAARSATGVITAADILRKDHYGWFDRAGRGVYDLSPRGVAELPQWLEAQRLEPLADRPITTE